MLISIHELTLTCKNSKKIALNSREVGVLYQSTSTLLRVPEHKLSIESEAYTQDFNADKSGHDF